MNMIKSINRFRNEESAATSVEYAVIIGLLVLACFAAIQTVGTETAETWNSNSEQIANSMNN